MVAAEAKAQAPMVLPAEVAKPLPLKLISNELVPFTKEVALEFKNMLTFVGDRKLHNGNTDKLVRQSTCGLFIGTESALISCKCGWDGKIRRVNGQHTASMRLRMPDDWNPLVQVRRYYVKTEEDFRSLYAVIDDISGKTPRQIVAAKCLGTKQFQGMNTDEINQLSVGIRIWKSVVKDKGANIHDTVRSMRNGMNDLCHSVSRFLASLTAEDAPHMYKLAPVVAAMFATFEKSEKDAREFWTIVRDGGKPIDHPGQKLMKYLTRVKVFTSNTRSNRKPVSREMMYRACLAAWNAYRDGVNVNLKREHKTRPVAK